MTLLTRKWYKRPFHCYITNLVIKSLDFNPFLIYSIKIFFNYKVFRDRDGSFSKIINFQKATHSRKKKFNRLKNKNITAIIQGNHDICTGKININKTCIQKSEYIKPCFIRALLFFYRFVSGVFHDLNLDYKETSKYFRTFQKRNIIN